MIFDILDKTDEEIALEIENIFSELHKNGPINQELLEKCALIKYFKPEIFIKYEPKLMYLLGLFYKVSEPKDLLSFTYNLFNETIYEETKNHYTPVQNCIYKDIKENKTYSFSAPTSAGKSFLLRKLISETENDVVIVVPSRALLAEYIYELRKAYNNDKSIMILSFVENINMKRTRKRIFVLTPERVPELFKSIYDFKISMFLFDEAQIVDDKIRGINFVNIVRKSDKKYPNTKKIFAHPFIENPEIQLANLELEGNYKSFRQSTVGKIFIVNKNSTYYLFNPYQENSHYKKNQKEFDCDIIKKLIEQNKSILVFTSKSKIINKTFISDFEEYINLCENVEDENALKIVERIKSLLDVNEEKYSILVELLKKGIVIHHGSVPLDIRFLLERFTNEGYARMCFSTSTLLQGVNMPFDALLIDTLRLQGDDNSKNLGLKNLIGRAGRTTNEINCFDYGFIVVKNDKLFSERIYDESKLSEISVLNQPELTDQFQKENLDAVINDALDEETNEPISRKERLYSTFMDISYLLDLLFQDGKMRKYTSFSENEQNFVRSAFTNIYEVYINRKMQIGELSIFNAGFNIMIWLMEGFSFKRILQLRYSLIAHGNEVRNIYKSFLEGRITEAEREEKLESLKVGYSPIPEHIPNLELTYLKPSAFNYMSLFDFNYDLLVYDTYDYVDKVVELSLLNPFFTAFKLFAEEKNDERAYKMLDYLRYGTIDQKIIFLKKYGFSEDQIEDISEMVISADENEIRFDLAKIQEIKDPELMELVQRYC